MPLKIKIMLLAILPMLIVAAVTSWIGMQGARLLSEQEIAVIGDNLMASKQRELRHYVELAQTSIRKVVANAGQNPRAAQERVKQILHDLTFGEDGYFFVYDAQGVNLVHPRQPELVGQNLYDLKDKRGEYVIRELLRVAREGGGYHAYLWQKPSRDQVEEKLGYVVSIPEWGWMFGTGLYVDDISKELQKIRTGVNQTIRQNLYTVIIVVTFTILIIILIGLAINLHESRLADDRLRELAHRSIRFHVRERRRFSRELHDGINQLMVSVLYRIELAARKLGAGNSSGLEDLQTGREVLNSAIQEVRRISHDLRPSILDDLGLKAGLASLLDQFGEVTGIRCKLNIRLPEQRLPDDIEISVYRLVQEALTNVERHADATEIVLNIDYQGKLLLLNFADNGRGFESGADAASTGIGLRNMRERVELLGGTCQISSGPGEGVRLRVHIPLRWLPAKGVSEELANE